MTGFFFDSYALLRVYRGDPGLARYADVAIRTDHGSVYEFTREVLINGNAAKARAALAELSSAERLTPTDEDMLEAAKLKQRTARISNQDALGYCIAQREELLFLTGDTAFRRMPGVEYIGPR